MRLTLEVARAVRAAVGEDVPVLTRISATDWVEGGWTIEDSVVLAGELAGVGVDLVDASSGGVQPGRAHPARPRLPGAAGRPDPPRGRRADRRGRPDRRARARRADRRRRRGRPGAARPGVAARPVLAAPGRRQARRRVHRARPVRPRLLIPAGRAAAARGSRPTVGQPARCPQSPSRSCQVPWAATVPPSSTTTWSAWTSAARFDGRADHGHPVLAQRPPQRQLGGDVQRRRHVVGDQQLGTRRQRPGQRQPLQLPAGQPGALVPDEQARARRRRRPGRGRAARW